MRVKRFALLGALFLGGVAGCRDELTTPGDCPALCPGGQPQVLDTVLTALPGQDSTYTGYLVPGLGVSIRVSNGLPASEDRGIVLILPRPDSLSVNGTPRLITQLDSAIVSLTLQARDTNVTGLKLFLYRIGTGLDSTTTFADVEPQLVPANLVDSIVVPDSVKSGLLRVVLAGADTAKLLPDTTGRVALGIAMAADAPSGVRLASIAATGSPNITHYVQVEIADTTLQEQVFTRFPQFTSFVSQTPPVLDPDLLAVGGAPSSRSLIRFQLTPELRDSVTILRATLELTPDATILGLPTDNAVLQAFGVVGDLGAKSPILTTGNATGFTTLMSGTSDTVEVDLTRLVRFWQTSSGLPQVVFLVLAPEAASFTEPVFRSSRSATGTPRLRITYYRRFPFEVP